MSKKQTVLPIVVPIVFDETGMPKNLFLVRHGESEGNLTRRLFEESGDEAASYTDEFLSIHESQYELTPKGVRQAKKAGAWLKKNKLLTFDRLLVSSNVRAMQTAAYLNLPEAKWMIDFNVREQDGGLFTVIKPSKQDADYADQKKFFNTQRFLFRAPQGENLGDVCNRIKIVLDTLARECNGKNVIIVCHGHVMRVFRMILERMSPEKIARYLRTKAQYGRIPNCSILHYTREHVKSGKPGMSKRFEYVRMIRPAGGGKAEDRFKKIVRQKFSNEDLLRAARKHRYMK